jgi:hypothetical protein
MRLGDSIIPQRMCLVFLPPERIMPRNIQEGICPSGWSISSGTDGSCTIRLGSSFPQGSETMASELFG